MDVECFLSSHSFILIGKLLIGCPSYVHRNLQKSSHPIITTSLFSDTGEGIFFFSYLGPFLQLRKVFLRNPLEEFPTHLTVSYMHKLVSGMEMTSVQLGFNPEL